MRKLGIILAIGVLGMTGIVMAQEAEKQEAAAPAVEQAVPSIVGNKVCPVSGSAIPDNALGQVTVDYNGKRYNLCCPSCKDTFLADPEKYSKIAEDSLANPEAAKPAEGMGSMEGMKMGGEGEQKK